MFDVRFYSFVYAKQILMEIVIYLHLHNMVVEKVISATTPLLGCLEYVQQMTISDYLPEGLKYQGKKVWAYYCKGLDGGWIQ
jgi:hypothetical protein